MYGSLRVNVKVENLPQLLCLHVAINKLPLFYLRI